MTPEILRTLSPQQAALLPTLLHALWHSAQGDWTGAHELAQAVDTPAGAWVHAYLHRQEGDAGNAAYWYRRAGKPVHRGTLEGEWQQLADALLAESATSPAGPRA